MSLENSFSAITMLQFGIGYQRGLKKKLQVIFVNCDNHSFNLVGVNVVSDNVLILIFFSAIHSLFHSIFLHISLLIKAERWYQSVKSEIDSQWTSRTDYNPVHE